MFVAFPFALSPKNGGWLHSCDSVPSFSIHRSIIPVGSKTLPNSLITSSRLSRQAYSSSIKSSFGVVGGPRRDNAHNEAPRAAPKHGSIASSSPMIIRSRGMNDTDRPTDASKTAIDQASTYHRSQIDSPEDRQLSTPLRRSQPPEPPHSRLPPPQQPLPRL